jgi:hypothetical protein
MVCVIIFTVKMEGSNSFETLVKIYQTHADSVQDDENNFLIKDFRLFIMVNYLCSFCSCDTNVWEANAASIFRI